MIIVKTYRGHIRNWEELCERLGIDLSLSREEREKEILIKAYQTWGYEMADHMYWNVCICSLDDEEKKMFLEDLGLSESGLEKLIKASYKLLGLISYLTAGEPEVRAWTIEEGN